MARWKNYVWMAAGLSALSLVAAFTARPLLAQIRAALVQNVDEPGRTPYLSTADLSSCGGFNVCDGLFATVPAGKRLVATNLTGLIYLETPGVISSGCVAGGTTCFPTVLQAGVFSGALNAVGMNVTLDVFIDGPAQPSILLQGTTNFVIFPKGVVGEAITLSGYLVDCASPGSCAAIVH